MTGVRHVFVCTFVTLFTCVFVTLFTCVSAPFFHVGTIVYLFVSIAIIITIIFITCKWIIDEKLYTHQCRDIGCLRYVEVLRVVQSLIAEGCIDSESCNKALSIDANWSNGNGTLHFTKRQLALVHYTVAEEAIIHNKNTQINAKTKRTSHESSGHPQIITTEDEASTSDAEKLNITARACVNICIPEDANKEINLYVYHSPHRTLLGQLCTIRISIHYQILLLIVTTTLSYRYWRQPGKSADNSNTLLANFVIVLIWSVMTLVIEKWCYNILIDGIVLSLLNNTAYEWLQMMDFKLLVDDGKIDNVSDTFDLGPYGQITRLQPTYENKRKTAENCTKITEYGQKSLDDELKFAEERITDAGTYASTTLWGVWTISCIYALSAVIPYDNKNFAITTYLLLLGMMTAFAVHVRTILRIWHTNDSYVTMCKIKAAFCFQLGGLWLRNQAYRSLFTSYHAFPAEKTYRSLLSPHCGDRTCSISGYGMTKILDDVSRYNPDDQKISMILDVWFTREPAVKYNVFRGYLQSTGSLPNDHHDSEVIKCDAPGECVQSAGPSRSNSCCAWYNAWYNYITMLIMNSYCTGCTLDTMKLTNSYWIDRTLDLNVKNSKLDISLKDKKENP